MRIIDADKLSHRVQAKIISELDDVSTALVHVCPCKE
jgi:divalent metal cation (Fe/Co/Zn/Cd) transporter